MKLNVTKKIEYSSIESITYRLSESALEKALIEFLQKYHGMKEGGEIELGWYDEGEPEIVQTFEKGGQ